MPLLSKVRPTPGHLFFLALLALAASCGGGDAPTASGNATGTPAEKPATGGRDAKPAAKGEASAKLAFQTARQLLLKGDPEKAAAEFQRATELDPKMAEAHFELGKLNLHLSAQTIGSQARDLEVLDRGLASMRTACELEPENDFFWFWLARGHFQKDKDQTAQPIEMLKKAIALNSESGPAWKLLGRIQIQAGDMQAASETLQRATELMPKDGSSRFHLGTTLEVLGRTAEARAAYEESIRLNPSNARTYESLLKVCAKLGDAEGEARANAGLEAWSEYQKKLNYRRTMVNKHPDDPQWVRRLGQSFFEVGKWEESIEWFMKAIHIDPKDGLAHLLCGVARRNSEDYENALNHLKEAEFLAPDNLDPKLELLRLYGTTKDEKSLAEKLAEVETAAAEHGLSLYALGEVCAELGRAEDARRLFDKAAAMGVTSAPVAEPVSSQDEPVPYEDE
jgi:tetratricopeptide (TPR) repeat protein